MNNVATYLPENQDEVRNRLYQGEIYLLPANEASLTLTDAVLVLIRESLGDDFQKSHEQYESDDFFQRIGRLRKRIYTSEEFQHLTEVVIESHDFPVEEQAYDPTRLRVISHKGHQNPGAAPIYYGHRDTWYSNPQAMITWWIPLHDVFPEETFQFFPWYFDQSVKNDSEIFDFDAWVAEGQEKRIGWQNKQTGRTAGYPQLRQEVSGETIDVIARKGEVLLFSGQHLHQTRKNETGKTRFSLDFRTVHLHDHAAEREPLNVDNRSTGSSLVQFVRPGARGSGVKNVP